MSDDEQQLHIIVFPWLAFGHILPFLELSKSLAKRGHKLSFISTPKNIQRLPKIPSDISHLINFVHFHLPQVQGLPENAEATSDIPAETVEHLKTAFDGLQHSFRKFMNTAKPDWIIQDFASYWIPEMAKKESVNVKCLYFTIFSAATHVFFGPPSEYDIETASRTSPEQFTAPPPWVPLPSKLAYRRIYDARRLFNFGYKSNSSGVSDMQRVKISVESCDAVAVRSSVEFEPEFLRLLSHLYDKPCIPTGLLPPSREKDDSTHGAKKDDLIEWLDKQRSRSVVYIAFGSEARLSNELIRELALGLELAEVAFIWALRWLECELPERFEERTKNYGIVAKGWVPQIEILSHESIGGFMTHVGWSSVIEGLQFGHPLVMLPIFVDQGLTARLMEDKGIGIEVERDDEDGSFSKEAVAKAIRSLIMEGDNSMRRKAKEIMKHVSDKARQDKYIDEFTEYLQKNR